MINCKMYFFFSVQELRDSLFYAVQPTEDVVKRFCYDVVRQQVCTCPFSTTILTITQLSIIAHSFPKNGSGITPTFYYIF